jgi:NAD(P)-dependent dehydrogenase (short-subunit alcohol dehydrogenase family)
MIQRHIDDAAKGALDVVLDRTFALQDAAAAHAYIESRQAVGRVLLIPWSRVRHFEKGEHGMQQGLGQGRAGDRWVAWHRCGDRPTARTRWRRRRDHLCRVARQPTTRFAPSRPPAGGPGPSAPTAPTPGGAARHRRDVQTLGRLDVLVNNAGIVTMTALEQFSLEDFDRMVAINVRAVFVAVQRAARYMGDGGRIITIGSVNADRMPFAAVPPTR